MKILFYNKQLRDLTQEIEDNNLPKFVILSNEYYVTECDNDKIKVYSVSGEKHEIWRKKNFNRQQWDDLIFLLATWLDNNFVKLQMR